MRVVGGVARGRPLVAPPGRGTRPTGDKVREAIFSMLASMSAVEGAAVVDLFAGTGALGIEALSRGAASATFVDRDGAALAAIRTNLAVLGELQARAHVVRGDAMSHLSRPGPVVDLVFADPPYRFDGWARLLGGLEGRARRVVAETSGDWEDVPGWGTVKVKRYGGTVVAVLAAHDGCPSQ